MRRGGRRADTYVYNVIIKEKPEPVTLYCTGVMTSVWVGQRGKRRVEEKGRRGAREGRWEVKRY